MRYWEVKKPGDPKVYLAKHRRNQANHKYHKYLDTKGVRLSRIFLLFCYLKIFNDPIPNSFWKKKKFTIFTVCKDQQRWAQRGTLTIFLLQFESSSTNPQVTHGSSFPTSSNYWTQFILSSSLSLPNNHLTFPTWNTIPFFQLVFKEIIFLTNIFAHEYK